MDGSIINEGYDAGIWIHPPEGDDMQFPIQFGFRVSNNEAEYKALIRVMRILANLWMEEITLYSDSQLVVQQVLGHTTRKINE